MQNTNTLTMTQSGSNDFGIQEIAPDYTGIYCFCGTIIFISILTLLAIKKISEKWRIDNFKLKQLEINKYCNDNMILIKKLNDVLDVLKKELK